MVRKSIDAPPSCPSSALRTTQTNECEQTIEQALEYDVLLQRALVKRLRRDHGDKVLGTFTVNQAYGGMRHATAMTYETSDVDPLRGVRVRDYLLEDVYSKLPRPTGAGHPFAEGMLWLLLTGRVPSTAQVGKFREELRKCEDVPGHVYAVVDAMPQGTPPMVVMSAAMLAMQTQSREAMSTRPRGDVWRDTLQDILRVITQQTVVAAYIYRTRCCNPPDPPGTNPRSDLASLDLAANLARMMGFDDPVTDDLFRLHLATHMDHGGGSASCLGVRVVGSTHADAFRAWSAGLNGLSGPLHGQASERSLRFLLDIREALAKRGQCDEKAFVREFVWETLQSGKVIPGYGHTTLLATDPRFHMQRSFAAQHFPNDPLCKVASTLYDVTPEVLKQHGRARNPYPNVDAHSGALLYNRGLTQLPFHTIMFATSRVMGPLANFVWDRALLLPIVRPMSVTTRFINAKFEVDHEYVPPGLPQL